MALKLSCSAEGHALCQPNSKWVGKDKAVKGKGLAQPLLYYHIS